ncbi:MAG: NAD(P)/FAD-dependent oxidoreductase [Verrucomicrobia bacterium]|nr:NAD(P)/FAD-dependent oxidoreductase [Verrucomicrobiota bacterium]
MRTEAVDVAIVGGSLSGSATALLLLRGNPGLRVLVLEKSTAFSRRVGESTVEVSAYFLARVLGLTAFNNETQLSKQGMRFWFSRPGVEELVECSEIGGRYLTRIPAWQVDRSTLDEEVLTRARNAGATVLRGAKVRSVRLAAGGRQWLRVETDGESFNVEARWVVDASGFTTLLARQEGWLRSNREHPTTACWARWSGVTDLDGSDLTMRYPEWSQACCGIRATATNHLVGDGWWAWVIPLKGGETSVGVVFDQRRVRWPAGPEPLVHRLKSFLCAHPMGRALMQDAEPVAGDVHWRANLAYWSDRMAGDGFVLVGDAAGFIDPLYSPGMDWLSFTVSRAVDLILRSEAGEPVVPRVDRHNGDFTRSYRRWFDAVYRDKYSWLGDFELMQVGFRLDLGLYYIGVVSQPFQLGPKALQNPVFSLPASRIPQWIMRTYNRRLSRMADDRRRRGTFGRANARHRDLLMGFLPDRSSGPPLLRALARWLVLEVREGWRTWLPEPVRVGPVA